MDVPISLRNGLRVTSNCPTDNDSTSTPALPALDVGQSISSPMVFPSSMSFLGPGLEHGVRLNQDDLPFQAMEFRQWNSPRLACSSQINRHQQHICVPQAPLRIWSWARPKLPNSTMGIWLRLSTCSLQSNTTNVSHPSSTLCLAPNKPKGVAASSMSRRRPTQRLMDFMILLQLSTTATDPPSLKVTYYGPSIQTMT